MKKHEMSRTDISKAKRRLRILLTQTQKVGQMMRGSIVTNGKKHRQAYFSLNRDKQTHLIYLGERRAEIARDLLDNYKRMLEIIEEMTTINMVLLKNDALK